MLDYRADAQKNILVPQFMIFMKLTDDKPDELIAFCFNCYAHPNYAGKNIS